jgi:hypothetical protein
MSLKTNLLVDSLVFAIIMSLITLVVVGIQKIYSLVFHRRLVKAA